MNKVPIPEQKLKMSDLVDQNEYKLRVIAVNEAGESEPSKTLTFISKDPFDKPSKMEKPVLKHMEKEAVSLSWSPPEDDGNSPITNYQLEKRPKGKTQWMRVNKEKVTDTDYTVEGLDEGTEYEFRVTAENKVGPGPPSDASSGIKFGKYSSTYHRINIQIFLSIIGLFSKFTYKFNFNKYL